MSKPNIQIPLKPKAVATGPWWNDPALRDGGLTAKADGLFRKQTSSDSTYLSAKDVAKRPQKSKL